MQDKNIMKPLLTPFGIAGGIVSLEWLLNDIAIKGAALLGIGLIFVWCLQRLSAAVRHLVLAGLMATLVLLPILSATLPQWQQWQRIQSRLSAILHPRIRRGVVSPRLLLLTAFSCLLVAFPVAMMRADDVDDT